MRLLVGLMVVLISLPIASAQEIISYNISVTLDKDSAKEEISVLIFNQNYFPLNTFSYSLRDDAKEIEVSDRLGKLDAKTVVEDGVTIQSKFREPLQPNASTFVTIRFTVPDAVSKVGDGYIFSPVFFLPAGTDEFRLRVRLPEGMGLSRPVTGEQGFTDVVPLPNRVYSDGVAIILEWWRYKPQGDFAVYIRYVQPRAENENLQLLIIIVVLFLGVMYLLRVRKKEKTLELSRDEERITELIKANPGVPQREIVEITGFSKAKVSSIISSLEKKGLIRKEKTGLINRLYFRE